VTGEKRGKKIHHFLTYWGTLNMIRKSIEDKKTKPQRGADRGGRGNHKEGGEGEGRTLCPLH